LDLLGINGKPRLQLTDFLAKLSDDRFKFFLLAFARKESPTEVFPLGLQLLQIDRWDGPQFLRPTFERLNNGSETPTFRFKLPKPA
jgi:hypothetical protein